MATISVTGFTKERMLQIENSTIVAGSVVGNDLILETREGTPINAGNVRGPQGIQGPPGEVTEAELTAAIDDAVNPLASRTSSLESSNLTTGNRLTALENADIALDSRLDALEAKLSKSIRSGRTQVTTDGSGLATISYGTTFVAGSISIQLTIERNSTSQNSCHLSGAPGTTNFTMVATANDVLLTNSTFFVHWTAIGTLA